MLSQVVRLGVARDELVSLGEVHPNCESARLRRLIDSDAREHLPVGLERRGPQAVPSSVPGSDRPSRSHGGRLVSVAIAGQL